jgi:hypothetical protein
MLPMFQCCCKSLPTQPRHSLPTRPTSWLKISSRHASGPPTCRLCQSSLPEGGWDWEDMPDVLGATAVSGFLLDLCRHLEFRRDVCSVDRQLAWSLELPPAGEKGGGGGRKAGVLKLRYCTWMHAESASHLCCLRAVWSM